MYKINTTHQFEKDLNSVRSSNYWNVTGNSLPNTVPICFMVVVKVSGNVTSSQTGC